MVAYSFKLRFVAPILFGLGQLPSNPIFPPKRQTIRAHRRRHARIGEEVQLYFGMRTKCCRLIGRAQCTQVYGIRLRLSDGLVRIGDDDCTRSICQGEALDSFARNDGFKDWGEMCKFWSETHPGIDDFDGVIIYWAAS